MKYNYEWRLKYIWPLVLSSLGAANLVAGYYKHDVANIVFGAICLIAAISIVYDNIRFDNDK